jgi:predicted Zn-dependent peptidase
MTFNLKRLANGLPFIHKHIPGTGIVDVRLTLRSGALYDKALGVPPGTAHFLEHIVHEKTEKYTSRDLLMKQIELKGGQRNATTYTNEKMNFYATVLKEEAELAADYVSQVTSHSILTDEATEKHRSIIIQECMAKMKQPEIKAWAAFKKAIFGGSGYEHRSLGTLESIAVISRDNMQRTYDSRFMAEHSVLSIYGDIDLEKSLALAESYFSDMKRGEHPGREFVFESVPEAEMLAQNLKKKFEFVEVPDAQAVAFFGGTMPGRNNPMHYHLIVLMQMLAGDWTSILYKILRDEKHLLYHVGHSTDKTDTFGVFAFAMNIDPSNIQTAIDIIKSEVEKAASGDIADDKITLAKTRIRAKEIFANQTVQNHADNDATSVMLFPDLKHPDEWIERIEAVTKTDMIAAAKHVASHLLILAVCANQKTEYEF